MSMSAVDASSSFNLTRTFEAPVSLAYRLWTDPALVARWWGIAGSTIPLCELDVRVGGRWRIHMQTASGKIYPNGGEYLEVLPHERIVYTDEPDPSIAEWEGRPPGVSRHVVHFEPQGARTMVTLEVICASTADRDRLLALGMRNGLGEGLDRLAELIAVLEKGHE